MEQTENSNGRSQSLSTATKKKKAAQDEVDLLKARLMKLKQEEQKAKAEADLFEERCQKVSKRRWEAQDKDLERKDFLLQIQKQQESIRKTVQEAKEKHAKAMEMTKTKVENNKKSSGDEVRRVKKMNECLQNIQKEENREKALKLRGDVRQLELTLHQHREEASSKKLDSVRRDVQKEIEKEAEEQNEKEETAKQLAAEEERLREKLEQMRQLRSEKKGNYIQLTSPRTNGATTE